MTWVFEDKVVRDEPAKQPLGAALIIVALTVLTLVFVGLFTLGLLFKWNSIPDQQMMGFWLGGAFLALGIALLVYRRFFINDVLVIKLRKAKLEDLTQRDFKSDE